MIHYKNILPIILFIIQCNSIKLLSSPHTPKNSNFFEKASRNITHFISSPHKYVSDIYYINQMQSKDLLKDAVIAKSREEFDYLNYIDNADDRTHKAVLKGYKAIELHIKTEKLKKRDDQKASILKMVHKRVKKVSDLDAPIAGSIENIDDYHKDAYSSLRPYKEVIDVNGDGNCAYRAFIISTCMNNHDHMLTCLRTLINNNFMNLFMRYDKLFESSPNQETIDKKNQNPLLQYSIYNFIKPFMDNDEHFESSYNKETVGQEIKKSLLQTLKRIEYAENNQEIIDIFNADISFDYYIIMFCRYMLADYIQNKTTPTDKQDIAMTINLKREDSKQIPLTPSAAIQAECEKVLTWKEWIDQLEIVHLSSAMETNIHPIQLDADCDIRTNLKTFLGDSHILFINNNHYQVLVKKDNTTN